MRNISSGYSDIHCYFIASFVINFKLQYLQAQYIPWYVINYFVIFPISFFLPSFSEVCIISLFCTHASNFDLLLTMHLSIILVIDQLNAHILVL